MIGRAYLWPGRQRPGRVENVLDILRGGIDSVLLGLGKGSIGDLTPGDLVVPPGFTRTLGGDGPVFGPVLDGQATTG
jgi:pre-mycofactocin synthase